LESFSPPIASDFTVRDYSPNLSEIPAPPLLRFPSGAIVGTHFIVAGTCLGQSSQFFSIWALDLITLSWSHIDTGSEVAYGSWFQGRLWRDSNKWIMFGDRNGSVAHDYSQRLSSWDYIAIIDLESFGIYQPPPLEFDLATQELCLTALEESVETDFELICNDGRKIRCSRKLIEGRWPWFHEQMEKLLERVKHAMEALPGRKPQDHSTAEDRHLGYRMSSRYLDMGMPYVTTLALLQYFYTLALLTPLQQNPAVLSELLTLSTTYHIPHLTTLVKHALHISLSESTCECIYDTATRCGCHSLRLRFVLAFLRIISCVDLKFYCRAFKFVLVNGLIRVENHDIQFISVHSHIDKKAQLPKSYNILEKWNIQFVYQT
jgi:leucine-zipper-like transcriptional regulator 1